MRKVVVFVTVPDAQRVRDAIALSGGDRVGNYSNTVYSSPVLRMDDAPRVVDEERIEFACDDDTYRAIVQAIHIAVPDTEATVDSWTLESI